MKKYCRSACFWSLVVAGLVAVAPALAATYQGPTQAFPNANVTAPLDTGSDVQSRQGEIQLGDKLNFITNTSPGSRLNFMSGQMITAQGGVLFTPRTTMGITLLANPSNVFQLNTTGLILPNMTTATARAMEGNLIYDSGQKNLFFYNGSSWQAVGTGTGGGDVVSTSSVWHVSGSNIYYTAGNVGIGTTNPRVKLDVVGHTLITADRAVGMFGESTQPLSVGGRSGTGPATSGRGEDGIARFYIAGPVPQALDIGVKSFGSSGGYGWLQSRSRTNYSISYDLVLNPNGGDVGIGTTAPNRSLHVYRTSGGNAEIDIQSVAGVNKQWAIYHDRGSNDLRFWNNAPAGEKNIFTITDSGSVSIGTTNPGYYDLKVYDAFGNAHAAVEARMSDSVAMLDLKAGGSGDFLQISYLGSGFHEGAGGIPEGSAVWDAVAPGGSYFVNEAKGSFISFMTDGWEAANERMRITAAGNVGIGVTNPQAQLHLQGGSGSIGVRLGSNTGQPSGYVNTPMLMWDATNMGADRVYWMRQQGNSWIFNTTNTGWGNRMTVMSVDGSGNIFFKPDSQGGSVNIGTGIGGYDSLVNLNVRGNLSLEARFGSQYVYSKGARTNRGDPRHKIIAWNHTPTLSDWAKNNSGAQTDWTSANRMSCDRNLNYADDASNCPSNDYPEGGSTQLNKYDYFVGVDSIGGATCPFPLPAASNPGANCIYYTATLVFNRGTSPGGDLFARNGTFSGSAMIEGNAFVDGSIGVGTTAPAAKLDVAGNLNFSGQKMCSAVVTSGSPWWRDTIVVPATWVAATCQSYASDVGTSEYQLGCLFSNSVSWGTTSGGMPSPNCGWDAPPPTYSLNISIYPLPKSRGNVINIKFSIPNRGNVKVGVSDMGGHSDTILNETRDAGEYTIQYTLPRGFGPGVWTFYVIQGDFRKSAKASIG